jgi:hypothetical protein
MTTLIRQPTLTFVATTNKCNIPHIFVVILMSF